MNARRLTIAFAMRTAILFAGACFAFSSCSGKNPASASITASETWKLTDVVTNQNWTTVVIAKLSDGGVSAKGSFTYDFMGYAISCASMAGAATLAGDSAHITVAGTASYPPDTSGFVESSMFVLTLKGLFKNNVSSGTWNIAFTDSAWQGWIDPGRFTGSLIGGSGVTSATIP
jgi:hypothetical protein